MDGKFFRRGGERVQLHGVTYGAFPDPQPDPEVEMQRIAVAGCNVVRVYDAPSLELLDAAQKYGLMVFAGHPLRWDGAVVGQFGGGKYARLLREMEQDLGRIGGHEALVGYFVSNEISTEVARWMGWWKTRELLEGMVERAREICPQVLIGYANHPGTERIEPRNADYCAVNVYVEQREGFAEMLRRLQHVAGERPLLVSEYGLDTERHGETAQAELLRWSRQEGLDIGCAGMMAYAWSDRWYHEGREVLDWSFGVTRRDGSEKEALASLNGGQRSEVPRPKISVIICVYNGVHRIAQAMDSVLALAYPDAELIVVDDGSEDGTLEVVRRYESAGVRLVACEHGGLSAARNAGAAAARGEIFAYTDDDCEVDVEWLEWIARAYACGDFAAVGGPNLSPVAQNEEEALLASVPGAPSQVMLDDCEAEHVPGCNLTVRREAFEAIGGFRVKYRVAGDDVDFCWRLLEAGYRIGYQPAAVVWHHRRATFWRYLKQQLGYGRAEALLMEDHPQRFSSKAEAMWRGVVYVGDALNVVGAAQMVLPAMQPERLVEQRFDTPFFRLKMRMAKSLQPLIRRWSRRWYGRRELKKIRRQGRSCAAVEQALLGGWSERDFEGISSYEVRMALCSEGQRDEAVKHFQQSGWCEVEQRAFWEWDLVREDEPARMLLSLQRDDVVGWVLMVRCQSKVTLMQSVWQIVEELSATT